VSYQREDERYWTDYLRVALPIVGLLLLVGLLWFWLASIIGDDDNDEPTPTPETALLVTAPASTATATSIVEITTTTGPAATNTPGGPAATNPPEATSEPTEGGGGGDGPKYAVDDVIVPSSDDVRLRSSPTSSVDDNIVVDPLPEGAELIVTGEPVEGDDGFLWWPVDYPDGEITDAYVADDFVEAESQE
jgi:hypothetical protein